MHTPSLASALRITPQAQSQIPSRSLVATGLGRRPVMIMTGAALMAFAAASAQAQTYNWNGPDNGLWSVGPWNDTVPAAGQVAVFSDPGAGFTVDIDVPSATVGGIVFNNNVADQWIMSTSASPLILDNGTLIAPITVAGSHTISAGFTAARGMAVTGGGKLTLSGTAAGLGGSAGDMGLGVDVYGTGTELVIGGSVALADRRDTHVVNNGKLTITGTYVTSGHDQIIGTGDHGGGTGEVILSGTGSWTHTGDGVFVVGNDGTANVGSLTINDSAVLVVGANSLNIGVGWAGGSRGTVTQNGGRVTNPSDWGTNLGWQLNAASSATYNLNGGVHETWQIWSDDLGTNVFNFNGGTLRVLNDHYSTKFITGLSHAYVRANGAVIDTNELSVALDQALEHGTPAAMDGGLTKLGLGTLTLTKESTYTGRTQVQAGGLACTTIYTLADAALEIDDSAKVDLGYSGTQSIPSLKIGGTPMASGIYGAMGSILPVIENDHLTGTGTVTVGMTRYELWITNYSSLSDQTPAGDPDGDGVSNQEEFAFGLDPSSGSSVTPVIAPFDKATGKFSYTRRAGSGLTFHVFTSTDLQTWTEEAYPVNEKVTAMVDDVQTVKVTVAALPVDGKLFVRVAAQ
ncbi:MAG: autotransporter-associated beta strand repeat-containing protein [Verrucomicrobia bacterium]|nr:autotransporter-associated beta strand repeat-containing protein [Verrucomicrobiota bacterium]